jgi:hypothetical protein
MLLHFKCCNPLGNRVLRRILGPKRDQVPGEWRRIHNKELYVLYVSPNIIRVIKSRTVRLIRHVARIGKRALHTVFWWEILREGTTWKTQA